MAPESTVRDAVQTFTDSRGETWTLKLKMFGEFETGNLANGERKLSIFNGVVEDEFVGLTLPRDTYDWVSSMWESEYGYPLKTALDLTKQMIEGLRRAELG